MSFPRRMKTIYFAVFVAPSHAFRRPIVNICCHSYDLYALLLLPVCTVIITQYIDTVTDNQFAWESHFVANSF